MNTYWLNFKVYKRDTDLQMDTQLYLYKLYLYRIASALVSTLSNTF